MMKKFLLPNKCWLALAIAAVFMAACGLKISWIKFSTHEPAPGSVMTIKANFVQEGDNNPADYYLLYAVRVPKDWDGKGLKVIDNTNATPVEVVMKGCEQYAQFCEYCFPKEGYKWVAYQSESAKKQGSNSDAIVELAVGEAIGDYTIDIVAGGWMYDPSELVKNGEINLDVAFGCNNDRSDYSKDDGSTYFKSSEYLFIAGTISDAEYKNRIEVMKKSGEKATPPIIKGEDAPLTLPIAPDIANLKVGADLSVRVRNTIELSYSAAEVVVTMGENFDAPLLSNPAGCAVAYSSSDENVATVNADGVVEVKGEGMTTIKAKALSDGVAGVASYALVVLPDGAIVDVLSADKFGLSDETKKYSEYTYTSAETGIEYSVYARVIDGCLQFSSENNIGMVVTGNQGGYIANALNCEADNGLTETVALNTLGLHKPYEATSDLKGQSSLNLKNGEYNFVGVQPNGGYAFLNKIAIVWVPAVTPDAPVVEGFTEGNTMNDGDKITIKGKPGQNIHYIVESNTDYPMMRAAATEGWTAADGHEYTYTVNSDDLPVLVRAKAVNGAGTHESPEVVFGIKGDGITTGVEAVEAAADNGEVEWFNLHGVRVGNPANGLYIRRCGNKVEKIFVK